jgi:hypothetical protein
VAQPRAGVDEDQVVGGLERCEHPREVRRVRRLEAVDGLAAGDDVRPVLVLEDHVVDGRLFGQDGVDARLGRLAEHVGEVRHPEVGVDQHDVVARVAQRDTERRRFPASALSACDGNDSHGTILSGFLLVKVCVTGVSRPPDGVGIRLRDG